MSSFVNAVFKTTIGLLVNKGRDKAAEKLKDGDVTDQKIRELIVRDTYDIKKKLDGSARKDLHASISFFKEGIELLYKVFNKARSSSECGSVTTQAACAEALLFTKEMRNLELSALDESATTALSSAKERFKAAREDATRAFNHDGLPTYYRILAMRYRIMATILETADNLAVALVPCRVCIKDLHCLPAVQDNFRVALNNERISARINTRERLEIISSVCHVNRVIYDVACMSNRFGNHEDSKIILTQCASVEIPDRVNNLTEVYPLFDSRVAEALGELNMEHVCVPFSFGQEGEEQHKIGKPQVGFATSSHGQFIIADYADRNIKVFDSNGKYQCAFYPTSDGGVPDLYVYDVATDLNDMIYILAGKTMGLGHLKYAVHVFSNTAEPYHKFPLQKGDWNRLLVNDWGKVMVQGTVNGNEVIDVYQTDKHVRRFGEQILKDVCDITAVKDGNVMVVDNNDSCIHLFSEWGDHLEQISIPVAGNYNHINIAFHRASERVVVAAGAEGREKVRRLHFYIYTKDGVIESKIELYREEIQPYTRTAMAIDHMGRIAVGFQDDKGTGRMLVL